MKNLSGQYIETIVIPFVIAIVALALPLMLDASSKISEQYKSSFMAKTFQKEFAHRLFVITLVVSVLAIVVYMLKLPVVDAFRNYWIIANSAVLLVYCSSFVLVIALLVLARIISIYYRQDRLLKYLTNKYNLKSKCCKKHDKDTFLAISKLMNYSIDNADEDLARGIFSFFAEAFIKFRIDKKGQEVVYPDEFYNTVFEASELLCRRQRQTVSYYNDGTLYDFFIDSYQQTLVSQKTIRFMWMCVIQNTKYDKYEYIFSLWKKIYQHVSLFLDNKSDLLEEKRKFVEFARVLCAYVLDHRKYELLLKMLHFTQMTPAKYALTPSSMQDVIEGCVEVLNHKDFGTINFPVYWESVYPWPGVDGADAESVIENKIFNFYAIAFLWQYILPYSFMTKGYSDFIEYDNSVEKKKRTLESLELLQFSVEKIYQEKELLSTMGLEGISYDISTNSKKCPKDWFDSNLKNINSAIEAQEDAQERQAVIPKEIIETYNDTVASSIKELFETNKRFFNNANKGKKTEKISLINRRDISRKSHIIQSMNYADTIGDLLATDYRANMWLPLLHMKVNKYVLQEDDVLKVAFNWKKREGLVILNFGIWLNEQKYIKEGLIEKRGESIFTKSGIEIIRVDSYPMHPILAHSILIVKQNDLPAIEYNDIDKEIVEELQLKICESTHKVYTSVIDFNQSNQDFRKKYLGNRDGEDEKYAMFSSYINTSLCFNPESKVVLLSVYNIFTDKISPQSPADVIDVWKRKSNTSNP